MQKPTPSPPRQDRQKLTRSRSRPLVPPCSAREPTLAGAGQTVAEEHFPTDRPALQQPKCGHPTSNAHSHLHSPIFFLLFICSFIYSEASAMHHSIHCVSPQAGEAKKPPPTLPAADTYVTSLYGVCVSGRHCCCSKIMENQAPNPRQRTC